MRVLIVINLLSGFKNGMVFDFMRHFSQDGDELVCRSTSGQTGVEDLLTDANQFDLVVAAGGDGTIATVCYQLRNTNIPILPFPAGTGNLLTTNLDIPEEPATLANIARNPDVVDFDLGEIRYEQGGQMVTRGFSVIAGVGYDADIMQASEAIKPVFGPVSYMVAALSRLNPRYSHFRIQLDDRTVEEDGIAVLLLNFAKINAGVPIIHDNNARDGKLEVVVLRSHNAVELIPVLFAAFMDRSGEFPGRLDALTTYLTRTVSVSSEPPLHLQHDGETPDASTPIYGSSLPLATRLALPQKSAKRFLGAG
ncbi:MAG: NAD(+)/NADH kinase [Actinomycetia bacterium]|nr:NAD(+)/NADH kinase [Actinomycetes bacterium]